MVDICIEPLRDRGAFLRQWKELYPLCTSKTIYRSPEWIENWLDCAPDNARLYSIVGSDHGAPKLMGVVSKPAVRAAGLGFKTVNFFHLGRHDLDSIYPEYNDFLIVTDRSNDAAALRARAFAALFENFDDADEYNFQNLSEKAAASVRASAIEAGLTFTEKSAPLYSVDLAAHRYDSHSFIDTLSASTRAKIRRSIRYYEKYGPVTGAVAEFEDEKRLAWRKLIELHEHAWRKKGGQGVFSNPAFRKFHEHLTETAPQSVQLFVARAGDEVIGVLYKFIHDGHVYGYQSGFSFEDDNRAAPGFVCHALAAQHYLEAGFDVYDLLAGEAGYKEKLAKRAGELVSLRVTRNTWRNSLKKNIKSLLIRRAS